LGWFTASGERPVCIGPGARVIGLAATRAIHAPIRDRLHDRASIALILAALAFNAALCFTNTMLFPVNDLMVIGAELLIVAAAMLLAVDRRIEPYLILALFFSYALLIMAMRPMFDAKAVRDFLIPIAFYLLGLRRPSLMVADRAALASGLLVVAFGLFEYLDVDTFGKYFNVIRYYVARGTVASTQVSDQTGVLFPSGFRPDARSLLPFLGAHRVSSLFLEPVSAGNFGVILYFWALSRSDMRGRLVVFLCAAVTIVLADARFGAYTCVAVTATAFVFHRLPRPVWFVLPFAIMVALAFYGFESTQVNWENNLPGRLLWTARLLTSLSLDAVMGISPNKPFLSDSGYAYSLNEIGIVGLVFFWGIFIFSGPRDPIAWRLRACIATYLCLLLIISDSPYSIKTAALLWFMLGASDGARVLSGEGASHNLVAARVASAGSILRAM
jgi:putative polymerase